ncbi:hypothetical protein [Deminuibacter soli]|uniref:Outer membrane protein beta-barrel domain-containing protein n=1 Tax=Deminuibacter soli TaxID=2291815 RepID=A0A3E1NLH6_9BACT|nr:hypothetical protein [Deminuibacter soli]RFM28785.1 hypothetical protein DXN05_08385 [Deminuibacter soli]
MRNIFSLLLFCTVFSVVAAAQSGGAFGVMAGFNRPLRSGYDFGQTWGVQGSIKLGNKLALSPGIGSQKLQARRDNSHGIESIGFVYLSVPVKYFINPHVFAVAGPAIYLGGDDGVASGLGLVAAIGYHFQADEHSAFEFALHTDVQPTYHGHVANAGLKIGYLFYFRQQPTGR